MVRLGRLTGPSLLLSRVPVYPMRPARARDDGGLRAVDLEAPRGSSGRHPLCASGGRCTALPLRAAVAHTRYALAAACSARAWRFASSARVPGALLRHSWPSGGRAIGWFSFFYVIYGGGAGAPYGTYTRRMWSCARDRHNGDIFACDHCVYPDYKLGNIMTDTLPDLVTKSLRLGFGVTKETALPRWCKECEVLAACQGGAPNIDSKRLTTMSQGFSICAPDTRNFFSTFASTEGHGTLLENELLHRA